MRTDHPPPDVHQPGAHEVRPVVVAPTYNNDRTIIEVLRRTEAVGLPIIVIDDGCTDSTAKLLKEWADTDGAVVKHVVTHPVNKGKGAALRTSFNAALEKGYTHAIALDTDGQLDPEQIPDLLAAARRHPDRIVLGTRDDQAADYPKKSRVGRRVSNFLVRLESGARVEDSQCGMRVYPLDLFRIVRKGVNRFGYETEILTRAAWAGCEFVHVPVRCRYLPQGERVSHFRPWLDSWRGVFMHWPLILRALSPWPHKKWRAKPAIRVIREYSLKSFLKWLSPGEAYRQLRQDAVAGPALAVGLGLGVLIANLPVYGFQTLLALYTARRLHLNPLATILGSQLSTPPIGPALIALGIGVGHLILHGSWPAWQDFNIRQLGVGTVLGPMLLDWLVGGLLVGVVLGIATFFATWSVFRAVSANPQTPHPASATPSP